MTKEYMPLNVNTTASNTNQIANNNNCQKNRPKFYCPENVVDEEYEENEDMNKTIEESPNGRWSKLGTEIFVQKLIDFDSAHLAIDTEKGYEIAWNEMKFIKSVSRYAQNRFENIRTLECIYEKLKSVLKVLIKLEHPNLLKFYDYWLVDNEEECKLVVITEYSSAGSLKKLLDSSKMSQTKIKPETYKRWLNQIIHSIKCLHNDRISIFQGHLNSETIFIQNSGVIKLTPTLLSLHDVCEVANNLIKCSSNKKPNLDLTNEIQIKDLHAIGRLAIEIFNAHVKIQSPTSPSAKSNRFTIQSSFDILSHMVQDADDTIEQCCLLRNLNMLDDELQKDFLLKCFEPGDDVNIDLIWFHPFINRIYSLKVLSVFSILTYFQDKKSSKRKLSSKDERYIHSRQVNINYLQSNDSTGSVDSTAHNQQQNFHKSSSNSSLTKSNSLNQFRLNNFTERRKVSLTFLTNYKNVQIPQDFFGILEDIRAGLYPRLFKHKNNSKDQNTSSLNLKEISSSSCLDFVLQQKQIIDRRSSCNTNEDKRRTSLSKINSEKEFEDNKENEPILIKYPTETRRIISENCLIKQSSKYPDMIELSLDLRFDDKLTRYLSSFFPTTFLSYLKLDFDQEKETHELLKQIYLKEGSVHDNELLGLVFYNENTFESKLENISNHLANELIDQGLINPKDQNLIATLFLRTIREFVSQ